MGSTADNTSLRSRATSLAAHSENILVYRRSFPHIYTGDMGDYDPHGLYCV